MAQSGTMSCGNLDGVCSNIVILLIVIITVDGMTRGAKESTQPPGARPVLAGLASFSILTMSPCLDWWVLKVQ